MWLLYAVWVHACIYCHPAPISATHLSVALSPMYHIAARLASVRPRLLRFCSTMAAPAKKFDVGPPRAATVPPGECAFGEEWLTAPLLDRASINHDTRVLTFGLPDGAKPLGLSTCACLLARGSKDAEGNKVVRPYTPISTNVVKGKMNLMVKVYPTGIMSKHMDEMKVQSTKAEWTGTVCWLVLCVYRRAAAAWWTRLGTNFDTSSDVGRS